MIVLCMRSPKVCCLSLLIDAVCETAFWKLKTTRHFLMSTRPAAGRQTAQSESQKAMLASYESQLLGRRSLNLSAEARVHCWFFHFSIKGQLLYDSEKQYEENHVTLTFTFCWTSVAFWESMSTLNDLTSVSDSSIQSCMALLSFRKSFIFWLMSD